MGNAASSAALLPAERVYALCAAFGLSVAEVEYCHRHYRALRFDAPHARRRGRGQPTDAAEAPAGPPAITDLLEADWLRARVFQTLFAVDDASAAVVSKTTLEAYLRALARWKNAGLPGRLALVFDVLDFDNDGWLTEADLTFKTGDRVCVRNSPLGYAGVLRFLGETEFREGVWAGIELDEPKGKNNGTVQGVQYFATEPKRGVFVDFPALQLESHFLAAHDILARIAAEPADRQPPANQIQAFGPRGVKVVWVSKEVFCARIAQEKWFAERIMQSVLSTQLRGQVPPQVDRRLQTPIQSDSRITAPTAPKQPPETDPARDATRAQRDRQQYRAEASQKRPGSSASGDAAPTTSKARSQKRASDARRGK